jgi:hypothetical protein
VRFFCILAIGLLALTTSELTANDQNCLNDCQSRLIHTYYQKIDKISMRGSTEKDVTVFLDSLHENVRYIHSQYEASFDKDTWRAAFLRGVNSGRYQDTKEAITTINKIIHGHNYAAVEFVSRYNDQDGNLSVAPPRLAVFKFQGGKISLIQEHWYHLIEE